MLYRDRFRDLDLQELRIGSGLGYRRADLARERLRLELPGRDIERDAQGSAGVGPAAALFARLAHDPIADGDHQPALFSEREEFTGQHHSVLGADPTQKSFGAD